MPRSLSSPTAFPLRKWCASGLVLLFVPGSLVVLPVYWLVRHFQTGAAQGKQVTQDAVMFRTARPRGDP